MDGLLSPLLCLLCQIFKKTLSSCAQKPTLSLSLWSSCSRVAQALVTSTPSERQRSLKRPGRKAKTEGDTKKGDQRGQQRIVVVERWKY